jgi:hypothetical protein
MNKEERARVAGLIKFELAKGTHTYTMCECGRHGCRSGRCWECYLETLVSGKYAFVSKTEEEPNGTRNIN